MLLFAVLKNLASDSDSSRLMLVRQGAHEVGTSWIRALVRERRQSMDMEQSSWSQEGTKVNSSSVNGGRNSQKSVP